MVKAGGSLADDDCSQELPALVEHELLDHLVGSKEKGLRDRQAQRLGSLEIDRKLERRRLLYREVTGLRTLQNPVHEECCWPGKAGDEAGCYRIRDAYHDDRDRTRRGLR